MLQHNLAHRSSRARHTADTVPAGEVFVNAMSSGFLQVLSNLFGNAIKFTPKDGRIDLLLDASATTVTFQIADAGPGIATDQLPHIFGSLLRGNMHFLVLFSASY